MNTKNIKLLIFLTLLVALISTNVKAFGITSFYTDQQPLVMNPGESKDVYLELQNMAGDSDMEVRAELVSGSEIAVISDKKLEYPVPLGKKDVKVNLKITIPVDALIGTSYSVGLKFREIEPATGGMISFGGEIAKVFPIVVGKVLPKEEKISGYSVKNLVKQGSLVSGALILLIIVGYVLVRNIKKRRNNIN